MSQFLTARSRYHLCLGGVLYPHRMNNCCHHIVGERIAACRNIGHVPSLPPRIFDQPRFPTGWQCSRLAKRLLLREISALLARSIYRARSPGRTARGVMPSTAFGCNCRGRAVYIHEKLPPRAPSFLRLRCLNDAAGNGNISGERYGSFIGFCFVFVFAYVAHIRIPREQLSSMREAVLTILVRIGRRRWEGMRRSC